MPLIRKSASDVTTYTRVNATSASPVAPNLRRPATYTYTPRQVIAPITRASLAAKGASPSNSVLQTYGDTTPSDIIGPFGGSMSFVSVLGDPPTAAWVFIEQSVDAPLELGTGDFTVEWWQYLSTEHNLPSVFSLDNLLFGVTVETGLAHSGRVIYVWFDGSDTPFGLDESTGLSNIDNQWAHIAVTRSGTTVRVFLNGSLLGTMTSELNIASDGNLVLGALTVDPTPNELFEGYLTNFRWVKGVAVYTSNFTPPNGNLVAVPGTLVLFYADTEPTLVSNAVSTAGITTITNTGVEWSSTVPS